MKDFAETRVQNGLSFNLAARLENIDQVCQRMEHFLSAREIQAERFDILLVLRELLNNAVIHGSKGNPDKRVQVMAKLESNALHLEVTDEGEGFDWAQRLRSGPGGLEACSGRGLYIAKCFTDSCTYNLAGNIVQCTKKVSSLPSKTDSYVL